jgi:hypothetical protein
MKEKRDETYIAEESLIESAKNTLNKALQGESTKFEFLECYDDLRQARAIKRAAGFLARYFRKAATVYMKTYTEDLVLKDEVSSNALLICKSMLTCSDFYANEAKIYRDMIKEYRCYLASGHLWKTLLLDFHRPEEDLIDWRELPFGW